MAVFLEIYTNCEIIKNNGWKQLDYCSNLCSTLKIFDLKIRTESLNLF